MTQTASPVSLDDVLAYRHPGVVRRYLKEHGGTREEAEELFREMLKWLYLCDRAADDGFACAMTEDLERVDWMWHAFVLFTRDYAEFCHRHFGRFLHHVPEDEDEAGAPEPAEEVSGRLERQYGYVYDVLGEEALRAWHDECRYAATALDSDHHPLPAGSSSPSSV
jgi:hypothetical protein